MNQIDLDKLFDRLWPICRSITGPGITESLEILAEYIPLKISKVPSGTKVFDWVVPPEWALNSACLSTEDGEMIANADQNNLHVMNFSEPKQSLVNFQELDSHLYSDASNPDAIPYVTSYYERRWGFCLPHNIRTKLDKEKRYKVSIDTELYDGFLRYGEHVLPGKSKETIIITSYLCHPSLANNELSGPISLVLLYNKLKSLKNRLYTYRFLLIPETIGSIAYLSTTPKEILGEIVAGIVLTCLGGPEKSVSFKHSRRHWLGQQTMIDQLVESFCTHDPDLFSQRDFDPLGGSDERQFCSPGIDLPVIQAARTIYGEYKEYHTSLDTKEFMNLSTVKNSADKLFLFLRVIEMQNLYPKSKIAGGEPMLSKRNLYPSLNTPETWRKLDASEADQRSQLNTILKIMSLADGSKSVKDIVYFLGESYFEAVDAMDLLRENELISFQ